MEREAEGNRYRAMRRRADLTATLSWEGGTRAVRLRDVSRDGTRIEPGEWIARGSAITLEIAGERIDAVVHWSRGRAAGVRFVDRVALSTLRKLERSGGEIAHPVSRIPNPLV